MKRSFLLLMSVVGAAALATATQAADVLPVTIAPAPVVVAPAPTTAAFVEVFGGFDLFNRNFEEEGECSGCHGPGAGFGGNGQAAWMMTPTFSMQLGVWGEHWSGRSDNGEIDVDWSVNRLGIGTHLSYVANSLLVGGFASIGHRDGFGFGTFATAGLEAATTGSRFRAYAQGGATFGVAPDEVRDAAIRNFYGRFVGTFYPNPNLALSANVGAALFRIDGGPAGHMFTWGTKADFQIGTTPLYFTASYQGAIGRYPPSPVNVTEHTFRVGLGLNIGAPDIQTRDRLVGLADFNCLYGVAGTPTVECGFVGEMAPPP